jgi:superfamily II DNA or RNA helicase
MIYELKTGKINPRDYQIQAYIAASDHIRKYVGPAFIEASVGAGKTIMIGMIAKRCQDVGMSCLVLARQGELIDQTSTEMWNMEVKNSIYSASLNSKSLTFSVVAGTEGTVARALD